MLLIVRDNRASGNQGNPDSEVRFSSFFLKLTKKGGGEAEVWRAERIDHEAELR